jgi:hypothetical protein
MSKTVFISGMALAAAILAVVAVAYLRPQPVEMPQVRSFEECVAAGNVILESYPRQCRTESGETFVEDIGNGLEKTDKIRLDEPRPNTRIASPLVLRGEARGVWYFEASFPVHLLDGTGTEIATGIATAHGEWMTEDFVPFSAPLSFATPQTRSGTLVLEKDNPSGLPQNADELRVPVIFEQARVGVEARDNCVITGCSGQLCAEQEAISTCEWQPKYACYREAVCERQQDGLCGWTQTPTLATCLAS